jgi:hypothetical protein
VYVVLTDFIHKGGVFGILCGTVRMVEREYIELRPDSGRLDTGSKSCRWSVAFNDGGNLSKIPDAHKGDASKRCVYIGDDAANLINTIQHSHVGARELIPYEQSCRVYEVSTLRS